jgi:membrane protein YqaA with SNARE-associated domain
MRAVFYGFLGYFLTIPGVMVMAALDSSMIFFLPLGIDFVVIIMAARRPHLFWAYTLLATAGSVAGAAFTFWIGWKVGEHGLSRLVKPSRLEHVRERVSQGAAVSVASLAIIPPPFPFTAFVLTSGAFRIDAWSFLLTLAGVRLLRFGTESALAAHYGRGILAWMRSPTFEVIVGALIALAIVGTAVSAIAAWRTSRRSGARS